jgi:hypothetical protein
VVFCVQTEIRLWAYFIRVQNWSLLYTRYFRVFFCLVSRLVFGLTCSNLCSSKSYQNSFCDGSEFEDGWAGA